MNMTSTTGRNPDCAAPMAMPQIAASEIGVLRMRSGAELLGKPVRGAPRPAFRDVLPEHEHARVGAHRLGERVGDRLEVRRLRHVA